MNRVVAISGLIVLLAAVQVYIGLNMFMLGTGGLHLHITLAVILLGLAHIPFLRTTGLVKKVFMLIIALITIQGVIGLYLAFVDQVRQLLLIHHISGWIILLLTMVAAALVLRGPRA